MNIIVHKVADSKELAQVGARAMAACIRKAASRGLVSIALAGGSTPKGLYEQLAKPELASHVPWDRVHVFWGDERHVPPDHPDSNYRMAYEALLRHVPVPPAHIHRIHGELPDAAEAAARYEEDIRKFFARYSATRPQFDVIVLGMGADGHTASLFPGSPAIHETTKLVVASWIEPLQAFRITMTPVVFNAARIVWFLVSGKEKSLALKAVLEGPDDPDTYPAQIVRPAEGQVIWLIDEAAASLLTHTEFLAIPCEEATR